MNATSMPCVAILKAPISVNAQRVSRAMGEIVQVIAPRKMALTDFGTTATTTLQIDDMIG